MDNKKQGIDYAVDILSPTIKKAFLSMNLEEKRAIDEIRLRCQRPLSVSSGGRQYMITENGRLTSFCSKAIAVCSDDIDYVFKSALEYSVHTYNREIAQGFVTVKGGNRIGICGTAVSKNDEISSLRDIQGINIRIAREIKGCADKIMNTAFLNRVSSVLIAGTVSSGKTTVLRDLTRQIGNSYKVSLLDERNEISASVNGVPTNDIGIFTDVFCSYPKEQGIITAVRVMSPDIIICDEIGIDEDYKALSYAINSGVRLVATVHAESIDGAIKRPCISRLLADKVFDYIIMLKNKGNISEILNTKSMIRTSFENA